MHGDERHTGEGLTDIAFRRDETRICARRLQQHGTSGSNNLFCFAHCWQISRMLESMVNCDAVVPAWEQIAQISSENSGCAIKAL